VRESSKQESFKASEFLNTETNDHNNNHCINSEQPPEYNNNISDLCGSPQTTTPKQCIPPFSAESLCTTQISSTHDLAIQPCQLTQEIADEFEECTRQDGYTHAIPCAFDDFGNQLVRNAYLPFVLHSPLQVLTLPLFFWFFQNHAFTLLNDPPCDMFPILFFLVIHSFPAQTRF